LNCGSGSGYPVPDPALEGGVADPYSFDTDSDPGLPYDDHMKKITAEKKYIFWDKKLHYLPTPRPP
jgi:hypothetical protein